MKNKALICFLMLFALAAVSQAADKKITDDTIYNAVLMKLATNQVVRGGALKVEVKNGVVTITGTVDKLEQKTHATKAAKKVKGVKEVINNITLRDKDAK